MSVIERGLVETAPSQVPNEVRDVLRDAKGLIVKGWMNHGTGERRGTHKRAYCVATAVMTAGDWGDRGCAAMNVLTKTLGLKTTLEVFGWNDTPGRTHAEVVALFDRALLS